MSMVEAVLQELHCLHIRIISVSFVIMKMDSGLSA